MTKLTTDAWLALVNVCAKYTTNLPNSTDTVYLYLYSFVHPEIVYTLYYTHKRKSQHYYCILVHTDALSLGTHRCLQNETIAFCSDYTHTKPSTLIVRYETHVILGLSPMQHCCVYTAVPAQVLPSLSSTYPSIHTHSNEPLVLKQLWWQTFGAWVHSFTSEVYVHEEVHVWCHNNSVDSKVFSLNDTTVLGV